MLPLSPYLFLIQQRLRMETLSETQLQRMALEEELRNYNQLAVLCFKECIKTTVAKDLSSSEKECIQNCYKKVTKFNERMAKAVGLVLLERNMKNSRLVG